jgi:hypothetical protein
MTDIVMELAGVSRDVAEDALFKYKDVVSAVDALLASPPVVSGDRFIPDKPTIDSGLSAEQEEMCRRGRDLQDKVNAVFSAGHSQPQSRQGQLVLSGEEVPETTVMPVTVPPPASE